MVHNLISEVYPHPEKFWITLETQNILGGVDFVGNSLNQYMVVDFKELDRDPYRTEDPKLRFEIKLIRYFVDSKLSEFIGLDEIEKLILCRVYDPEAFAFPENRRYAIYFPTTNTLAMDGNVPFDKRVFETNTIFVQLLLKS